MFTSILSKLKLYSGAVLLFFLSLFYVKRQKERADRYEAKAKAEKGRATNYEKQAAAARKNQDKHQREIDDALEDGSYRDYFDKS